MSISKEVDSKNKQKSTRQDIDESATKEMTVRMNVNIAKSFHKQIKKRALNEDITVTELVHRAIKEYMNKTHD